MAALTASMISCPVAPVAAKPAKAAFTGLARVALPCKAAPSFAQKTLSNGCRTRQMLVWEPVDNKCAPTFKPTFGGLSSGCCLLKLLWLCCTAPFMAICPCYQVLHGRCARVLVVVKSSVTC